MVDKESGHFYGNSIYWIEVDRIRPNPYQPRHSFDEDKLNGLAESIRQYGVLQPLVVTRHEVISDEVGMRTEYELMAGERRLRASKIAGLSQVPVLIRTSEDKDKTKLEIAIIENIQREDLNPIDRASAFQKLVDEFGFKQVEVARKIGKSREYITNSIRLLMLPEDMQKALVEGIINEGHTRPILMLIDRPEEQRTLFKEIAQKKITVREAESIARKIAKERVRKHDDRVAPELLELERELTENLGTRVLIEPRQTGGKLIIEFDTDEDLFSIRKRLESHSEDSNGKEAGTESNTSSESGKEEAQTEEDLYSVKNFSV
jgi:ParB family transcriptional regulator, chromosome partitioning protein